MAALVAVLVERLGGVGVSIGETGNDFFVRPLWGYLLVCGAVITAIAECIWTTVAAFPAEAEIHSVTELAQAV